MADNDFNLEDCFSEYSSDSSSNYDILGKYISFDYHISGLDVNIKPKVNWAERKVYAEYNIRCGLNSVQWNFEDPIHYDDIMSSPHGKTESQLVTEIKSRLFIYLDLGYTQTREWLMDDEYRREELKTAVHNLLWLLWDE